MLCWFMFLKESARCIFTHSLPFTAEMMSFEMAENTCPLFTSVAPLLWRIFAHLLCPAYLFDCCKIERAGLKFLVM